MTIEKYVNQKQYNANNNIEYFTLKKFCTTVRQQ